MQVCIRVCRRRRLILAFVVGCLAFATASVWTWRKRSEVSSAAKIEQLGGYVEWTSPLGPEWLPFLVGDGVAAYLRSADRVSLDGLRVSPDEFTDALRDLSPRELSLRGTCVTDDTLVCLRRMSRLRVLDLSCTPITQHCVSRIACVRTLSELYLTGCNLGPDAVHSLRTMLSGCEVYADSIAPE
jgi:hypothetical protein